MAAFAADTAQTLTGTVVEVQKYGNLTMDLKPQAFYDAGFELGDVLAVTVGPQVLTIPFCTSYSDVDTGSLVVRHDQKNDLIVVAINMGNFSTKYGVKADDRLTFALKEKKDYLTEYLIRQLKRTNNRSDYATDSPQDIAKFLASPDFRSDYYKSLLDASAVIPLNMGVDLTAPEFGQKLAEGLRFLARHEGPYLFHCTEGKDRTGFVAALLEALMGANKDEIVADYMESYINYFKVEPALRSKR